MALIPLSETVRNVVPEIKDRDAVKTNTAESLLVINLNFNDISLEAREKLASVCLLSERVLILDLAYYESFSVNGHPVERRVWKDAREAAAAEAEAQTKCFVESLEAAFADTQSSFETSFSYQGVPLWDVLKAEFSSAFFKRCSAYLFLKNISVLEKSKRILFLPGSGRFDRDLEPWTESLEDFARVLSLEFAGERPEKKTEKAAGQLSVGTGFSSARKIKELLMGFGKEKTIVFGPKFFGTLQNLVPVLERLREKSPICLWVSDADDRRTSGLIETAVRYQIPYRLIKKKFSWKIRCAVSAALPELLKRVEAVRSCVFSERRVNEDVLSDAAAPIFSRFFSSRVLEETLFRIESLKQHLDRSKIKRIILDSGQMSEQKICCFLARRRKIKTILVPYYTDQLSIETHAYSLRPPFWGDQYLVMGEKVKRELIACGVNAESVTVTGLPKFNIAAQMLMPKKIETFFRKRETSPRAFTGVFVWVLQGFPEERLLFEYLEQIMVSFPEKLLIIRPHPLTAQKSFLKTGPNIQVYDGPELNGLLSAVELVITATSITAFEAILRGKPVLILNLWHRPYPFPFLDEKAAIEVTKKTDILPAIQKILQHPETIEILRKGRQMILSQYHPGGEVDAVEQILEAIQDQKS